MPTSPGAASEVKLSPRALLAVALAACLSLSSCKAKKQNQAKEDAPETGPVAPLQVAAVNHPLAFAARVLGGEYVSVVAEPPKGTSARSWTPDARAMKAFEDADLLLRNGADFAPWVDSAMLTKPTIVDTSEDCRDRYITEEVVLASDGKGKQVEHRTASVTWLDTDMARCHTSGVLKALSEARPELTEVFKMNLFTFAKKINEAGDEMAMTFARFKEPLLGATPAYQYLGRAYELELKSMEWDLSRERSAEDWRELDAILKEHEARVMLFPVEPRPETLVELRKRAIVPVLFRTCGSEPPAGDILREMHANAERLGQVMADRYAKEAPPILAPR